MNNFKRMCVWVLVIFLIVGSFSLCSFAQKPKKLVLVSHRYPELSRIWKEEIFPRFERDYGVKVEAITTPPKQYFPKVLSMFAAGEQIDVVNVWTIYLGAWAEKGMLIPVTNKPELKEYEKDLLPPVWEGLKYKGEVWGLPYYSDILSAWYYEDKFKQAGLAKPPTTYGELVEQALKMKEAGICKYPILWVGGLGKEQIPWMWFQLTSSQGGTIFDKNLNLVIGPGSVAYKTLEWWRKTFLEWEVSDPISLQLRFTPARKTFQTGDYAFLLFMHRYYIRQINDPEISPIAGRVREFMIPGNHRPLSFTLLFAVSSNTINEDYAWKLVQYVGGKIKGEPLEAKLLELRAMLGTGYKSLFFDIETRKEWSKYTDVDFILEQWRKAIPLKEVVPALYESWYPEWQDFVGIQLQQCLSGKISTAEAIKAMIQKAEELKAVSR
ncbi:extracellular solute-binding protein [Candidatus Aerophobetes bacterium]|nr:extracellular solute-binding protein [Candidatus Aerophobetes bacterium]